MAHRGMRTFNRIAMPIIGLALVYPEVQLWREDSPAIIIIALIQLGIGIFIWRDWHPEELPPPGQVDFRN